MRKRCYKETQERIGNHANDVELFCVVDIFILVTYMDKEHKEILLQKALQGATVGTVDKFGSAVKEHLVAFSGKDQELGTETTRSLKSISKSKVNPEYKDIVFDGDMPTVIVAAAIENKYVFSRRMLSSGLNRYR